jgi:hypothetical protein
VSSLGLYFVSLKFSKTTSLTQNNLHPSIFLQQRYCSLNYSTEVESHEHYVMCLKNFVFGS